MITTKLLPAGLLWLRLAAAQCFNLDGSQVTEPDFVPCNPTPGAVSMCCALNRSPARTAARPDLCLANGLCQAVVADATTGNQRALFIRESCNRADWVGCLPNVCPRVTADDAVMTACAPTNQTTQWCCGDNNQACCRAWPNHPDAASIPLVFNPAASPVETAPPVSFFTITGSSTGPAGQPTSFIATQTAGFGTGNPTPIPTDSGIGSGDPGSAGQPVAGDGSGVTAAAAAPGLSTQAIAGIAAGVVVVVVVLVTVGCFMAENWYKKRNRIIQVERRGSLKNKIRLGFDRDSPERARQIM